MRRVGHGEQLDFDFMESELACEMYCDELLDGAGRFLEFDSTVSVSGNERPERPESQLTKVSSFLLDFLNSSL